MTSVRPLRPIDSRTIFLDVVVRAITELTKRYMNIAARIFRWRAQTLTDGSIEFNATYMDSKSSVIWRRNTVSVWLERKNHVRTIESIDAPTNWSVWVVYGWSFTVNMGIQAPGQTQFKYSQLSLLVQACIVQRFLLIKAQEFSGNKSLSDLISSK